MDRILFSDYKNIIFVVIPVVLLITCLNPDYLIYLSLILLIVPIIFYNRDVFLFFIIVSLLTLVGDVSEGLRVFVLVFCYMGLGYLFLKKYGFDFIKYPRVPKELLLFLAFLFFSLLISSILSKYTLTGFMQIFYMSALFILMYLIYGMINSIREIKIVLCGIVLASLIMASSAIYNMLASGADIYKLGVESHLRFLGILSNVSAIGGYIAVVTPMLVVSLLYTHNKKIKGIIWCAIVIECLGLITISSRGGMLSVLGSCIFLLIVLNRKLFIVIMFMSILLLTAFFMTPWGEFIIAILRLDHGFSQRDNLWMLSIEMIKHNFFFGVGPGAWGKEMFNYLPVMLDSYAGQLFSNLYTVTGGVNNSHNFYLAFFSDMGIFGLICSIALPVVYFKLCYKTIKKIKQRDNKIYLLILGASAIGVGMFIRGFIEEISIISYRLSVDIPFWTIFVIVIWVYQNYENFNIS
jgi:O-antigen ligase